MVAENGPDVEILVKGNGTKLNGLNQHVWALLHYHCLGYLYLCHANLTITLWINIREDVTSQRVILYAQTDAVDAHAQGLSLSVINKTHWEFESVTGSGLRNVSVLTASWRRWVHLAAIINVNDSLQTTLFINGRSVQADTFTVSMNM